MTHACDFCSGKQPKGKSSVLGLLRLHPNISTSELARTVRLSRSHVFEIRRDAEALGCLPVRTMHGNTWRMRKRRTGGMARVYPIGTTWTAEATARRAA